jgi:hypothetical protein
VTVGQVCYSGGSRQKIRTGQVVTAITVGDSGASDTPEQKGHVITVVGM